MSSTRLEKQVEKLEAELKEKKAQISREKRKERGGQLVALGIMVEVAFKGLTPEGKAKLRSWAEPLDARNKQRVLAALSVWAWKKERWNQRHKQNSLNPSTK